MLHNRVPGCYAWIHVLTLFDVAVAMMFLLFCHPGQPGSFACLICVYTARPSLFAEMLALLACMCDRVFALLPVCIC